MKNSILRATLNYFFAALIALIILSFPQLSRSETAKSRLSQPLPKVFVLVIFDQMRADYLTLNFPAFDRAKHGGFRWLIENSAYYPFATYETLQCITAVGHSVLSTGAYPYRTGIVLNNWYDRKANRARSSVDVSTGSDSLQTPPQIHNLFGTTFSDELKSAYPSSRVLSVSLKDRGAIFTGGHQSDLTVWLDLQKKRWTSNLSHSSVDAINAKLAKNPITDLKDPAVFTHILEATELAAKALKIGNHATPDFLSISFSNFDYAGHEYGPGSDEMKAATLSADRAMKRLLAFLNRSVPGGLDNVVLAVSADHGAPPSLSRLQSAGINSGQFSPEEMRKELNERLRAKFGAPKGADWIAYHNDLNFFFDSSSTEKLSSDKLRELTLETKKLLQENPQIFAAFTREDVENRKLPPGKFERQILNSFYAERSGDVVAIPKPYFFENGDPIAHMTGYSYDQQVPLILFGKPFKAGLYSEKAEIIDVVPTLSFLARTIAPSQSEGRVLSEALTK